MVSRWTGLVVDCGDPRVAADFWQRVLAAEETGKGEDWVELRAPGADVPLLFLAVPDEKRVKDRLHLDVSPVDRDMAEEVERLIELGAEPADVGQGEDASWVVLRDPDGHEFCVLGTRVPPAPDGT